jgi:hypothetical protein
MQQRQLRLGDILDDYCPRERRLTNHAVVAMVGPDVKQTRCTTCDAEHEYKNAKVPRQRKKSDTPAVLYSQVLAGGPKRVEHDASPGETIAPGDAVNGPTSADEQEDDLLVELAEPLAIMAAAPVTEQDDAVPEDDADNLGNRAADDGPAHRRLIRAQLPRTEGQPPPTRPAPDFTIRQPNTRANRFRPRQQRGPGSGPFQTNRTNGSQGANGNGTGGNPMRGAPRQGSGGGRPPMPSRATNRQGPGRKRSK